MLAAMRGVYAIYDRSTLADDALASVDAVLETGVTWLQYRDKRTGAPDPTLARRLADAAHAAGVGFIVNDDWRLALDIGADGVHLGTADGDCRTARAALGPDAVIGASCQSSIERGRAALEAGASYLSFGRFFTSETKPDAPPADPSVLGQARALGHPIVTIGGIDASNASTLIEAGTDAVAVSGAIFRSTEPAAEARKLVALFDPPQPN
ncbi:thiamine phosphate synthase [Salinisphaera orenii]|uniref:thiamine phosphate synthase n=1 Tax=Salinisphaera orenii TaxID=856731 RepID=UPI000DBE647E